MSATVSPPGAPEYDDGRQSAGGPAAAAAFGEFLAAARRRSGLSLEDISATTKVGVRHLESLEHGAIDQLPGGVYRRAWIRSYAVAVGLPPDDTLDQFDRLFAPPPPAPNPDERRAPAPGPAPRSSPQPPAPARRATPLYPLPGWVLPVAVLVAAASVASLLRSERSAPSSGGDSRAATSESGAPAAAPANGSRLSDIVLVPDVVPEQPVPDPRLVITSRPSGARVTVNGIGWGVTPITIRNLPPGPKLIRATKDGYVGRETSVEFGLTPATIRLVLQQLE